MLTRNKKKNIIMHHKLSIWRRVRNRCSITQSWPCCKIFQLCMNDIRTIWCWVLFFIIRWQQNCKNFVFNLIFILIPFTSVWIRPLVMTFKILLILYYDIANTHLLVKYLYERWYIMQIIRRWSILIIIINLL